MTDEPTLNAEPTSVGAVPMNRLHAVFDSMFDGVWMVSPTGHTTYANEAMASLLGLSRTELVGRKINDFLDESLWPLVDGFLERQQVTPGERVELRFRRADGRELIGMLAGSPITTLEGSFVGTMLNFSDVTGKRAFEAQFAQNEKMQAIGEFAGGLAHDFNNLLTAIRGHAELARVDAAEGLSVREDLEQVIVGADRAGAITKKLLAFTRRQVLEPVLLDPGQLISDLLPMLSTLLGDAIDIVVNIAPHHHWVRVDPVQFEQVIVNLVVNAQYAMPGGGTLRMTVTDVETPRTERPGNDALPDADVRITVADTGQGMDAATIARVFDPFFTTKPLGKGTGLGLATVFGIVTQSGGAVRVESRPGNGASFIIDLPGVSPPAAQPAEPSPALAPIHGSGVVLLVEDEPLVREFARRTLEAAGFTVLSTPGGKEALRASERWANQIDVVLTDVVMNGMQGPEVVERVRAERPDVAVIYMSGYALDIVEREEAVAFDAFVPKPFTGDTLARAVNRVILASRLRIQSARTGAPGHAANP